MGVAANFRRVRHGTFRLRRGVFEPGFSGFALFGGNSQTGLGELSRRRQAREIPANERKNIGRCMSFSPASRPFSASLARDGFRGSHSRGKTTRICRFGTIPLRRGGLRRLARRACGRSQEGGWPGSNAAIARRRIDAWPNREPSAASSAPGAVAISKRSRQLTGGCADFPGFPQRRLPVDNLEQDIIPT